MSAILKTAANRFAHLMGGATSAPAAPAAEKEEKDEKEDGKKSAKKSAEKEKDDTDTDGDGSETEKLETEEEEEPESEDDKKGKKAKKAKKEEDDEACEDEDDESEMRGDSEAAQARRRENARCAAIFASPAAAKNPALAASLAFDTRMTRKEAIAVLANGGVAPAAASKPKSLAERMGNEKQTVVVPNASAGGEPTFAQRMAAAVAKANGK